MASSARAAVPLVLDMNVDWVLEVTAKLFRFFLQQGISRNNCGDMSAHIVVRVWVIRSLPSKACSTLIASFALVSKYGIPPLDWQNVMARLVEI